MADIISLNRAVAAAIKNHGHPGLGPGELDRALRGGRVVVVIAAEPRGS